MENKLSAFSMVQAHMDHKKLMAEYMDGYAVVGSVDNKEDNYADYGCYVEKYE